MNITLTPCDNFCNNEFSLKRTLFENKLSISYRLNSQQVGCSLRVLLISHFFRWRIQLSH